MSIRADLHTHSVASRDAYSGDHATATRAQLAASAAQRGIDLIVVSDHGPACPGAADRSHFVGQLAEPAVIDGVLVLAGIEADPVPGTENGLDLDDADLELLDFVTVGFHPYIGCDAWTPERMTEALVAAIANPFVDMICHPGNAMFPVDIDAVVRAAVEHHVIVELNAHSFKPGSVRADAVERERAFLASAIRHGAQIALNSDAHHADGVGDVARGEKVAEEYGLTLGDFVNSDARRVIEVLEAKRPRPRLAEAMGKGGVAW